QKLAASRRSNNLCARFFTARGAMKKSPHEPRRRVAAGAASASRQRPAAHKDAGYESDQKPCSFVRFFSLKLYRQAGRLYIYGIEWV
ncbi:MAG: hypothetical protein KIC46_03805, partial [Clostridiales bacterium]|nr:hypothetical protein [Clostridiales bacterium]